VVLVTALASIVAYGASASGCSVDTDAGPHEAGYIPGDAAECAPLREALHEPRAGIVKADALAPGDGRTALEAALAERVRVFLERQCYRLPGWEGEDGVHLTGTHDTGDTHGYVRVFYSPEVVTWLRAGRPAGAVPARAVVVKERYAALDDAATKFKLVAVQPMVRRPDDVHDGWFWADVPQAELRYGELRCDATPVVASTAADSTVPDCRPPSGFGQPCLRCHGSAPSDLTFSQLNHLPERTGGQHAAAQTIYDYRREWSAADAANPSLGHASWVDGRPAPYVASHPDRAALARPRTDAEQALAFLFPTATAIPDGAPSIFPSRLLDHVVAPAGEPGPGASFLTSDQCWACHSGVPHVAKDTVDYATGTLKRHTPGHSMLVPDGAFSDGRARYLDVSPYGGWSMSLMGLAGKDPVFFAQHEWETTQRAACAPDITNLCYTCHGAAGKRQLELDAPGRKFAHETVFATAGEPDGTYGALARDGVTCTVCHRMGPEGLGTPASYTGNWKVAPSGSLHGPFADDVRDAPMKAVLGLAPAGAGGAKEVLGSSAMCGSCHAVKLPVYRVGSCEELGQVYEQATFLEWRNSDFRKNDAFITDEGHDGKTPATCQGCHMPQSHGGVPLAHKIASVEDTDFPTANLEGLPGVHKDVALAIRTPFSAHTLRGINLFTLGMFQQFPQALGITDYDFMANQYGEPIGLQMTAAIEGGKEVATQETAKVEVIALSRTATDLAFDVGVTNLAGHRLPSGVSFRRVILQVEVSDGAGAVLWSSGRIDARGLVVGADGVTPLATELSMTDAEPHHELITSEGQAQIYEEKVRDSTGQLTTSFLGIATSAKDNRLLPRGFRRAYLPTMEHGEVPEGLLPHGTDSDPDYAATDAQPACGCDRIAYRAPLAKVAGAARITARLFYQALPPYYLRDRFALAGSHPDARRLAQLTTHLNTQTDAGGIRGWKVFLTEATRAVQ
jgi:hypothetical protein